ncbi:MAG: DEAD/DEAH box helicase [Bdellovibrionota bacterium]
MPDSIFLAVREMVASEVWSKGVALSRQNLVALTGGTDGRELSFRVSVPNRATAAKVVLWLDDDDWNCDCSGPEDPCEHVAAAVIALRRVDGDVSALPSIQRDIAEVGYRFREFNDSLELYRSIKENGREETRLSVALTAIQSGRVAGPEIAPSKDDLAIEFILGVQFEGIFPVQTWRKLKPHLSLCRDLKFAGNPVSFANKAVGLILKVEDENNGVVLRAENDPSIQKIYDNGVAFCGESIALVDFGGLSSFEVSQLKRGKFYSYRELTDLATRVLPELSNIFPVENCSKNLPEIIDVLPKAVVETRTDGKLLKAEIVIYYGSPPVASVREGELQLIEVNRAPKRNQLLEEKLIAGLEDKFGFIGQNTKVLAGQDAVDFSEKLAGSTTKIYGNGVQMFRKMPPLAPKFFLSKDEFKLEFVSTSSENPSQRDFIPPQNIFDAWDRGEHMVPLINGGWAEIPKDWLLKYGDKIRSVLAAREAVGGVSNALKPQLASLCSELGEAAPENWVAVADGLKDFSGFSNYALPQDIKATLRPYQEEGVRWLRFLTEFELGGVLADDMGLGKTLQAISIIKGRTLVVAPTSVIYSWENEIKRFRPNLSACVYHGGKRQFDQNADVIITSYAILRLDKEIFLSERWSMFILDEAQYIKNPDSQVTKVVFEVNAKFKLSMSGTPIENRLEELWSQINFSNPGMLGGRRYFIDNYVKKIQNGDMAKLEELRTKVRPFILRRKKVDVAKDLPARTTVFLQSELSTEERKVYDSLLLSARKDIAALVHEEGNVLKALEVLLRLRQAACHVDLVPGQSLGYSSKLALVLETLEKSISCGHKTLIFSQWTSLLDKVEAELINANIKFLRLDGATRDRKKVVEAFQTTNDFDVMIISLKAGGAGLTLTAADHVMILDPWWNPAVEDQAADRSHRIGQDKPVLIQKFVSKDTVEERILELQERKRALAASIFEGMEGEFTIGKDDILGLIEA